MTFPPSLHPNSFSFHSFDLNIFFLQCKQSSSLFLSVESAISKRLEGLKFVNFLGAAPLEPSLECAVNPSCFTRPLRGLAMFTHVPWVTGDLPTGYLPTGDFPTIFIMRRLTHRRLTHRRFTHRRLTHWETYPLPPPPFDR